MKRLLLSSGLVMALMGQAGWAQTTTDTTTETGTATDTQTAMPPITTPEGYAREEDALTAEELLKATIYDATGEAVGEVHDLVLEDATADATTTEGAGTDNTATDNTATDNTGTDNTATGTDTTATDTTGTDTTGTDTTGTDTTATAPATGETDTLAQGRITHAVLDVGGFLGIGEHRVAVPASDLAVYGNGTDVRIYLPWSKEQLKAQPSYDPNDPNTLGRPMVAPAN